MKTPNTVQTIIKSIIIALSLSALSAVNASAIFCDGRVSAFLSADPLGQAGSLDLYSYCNGDPVNGLDPDGRMGTQVANDVSSGVSEAENGINQFGVNSGLWASPDQYTNKVLGTQLGPDPSNLGALTQIPYTLDDAIAATPPGEQRANLLEQRYGSVSWIPQDVSNQYSISGFENAEAFNNVATTVAPYVTGAAMMVNPAGDITEGGMGLIGLVKAGGVIDPSLQSAYVGIANSSAFTASLARYNSFALTFGLKETASVEDINAALLNDTTFARTSNINAGIFPTEGGGFYLQGNPLTAYGVRAGGHELVHLGAALNGQTDTILHEIGVQYATTPENLVIGGGILAGGVGSGIYYSTH